MGVTWTSTDAGAKMWWALACSNDGSIALTGAYNEYLYTYPDSVSASNSDSDSSCFSGDSMISLHNGDLVAIRDVRVGDSVLGASRSGDIVPSTVIAVPHGTNDISAVFVQIITASGKDLMLTSSHLILSGSCEIDATDYKLVEASKVAVGSCVINAFSAQERDIVVSSNAFMGKGVYTVVTESEYIIVNDFIVSSFAFSHYVGTSWYGMHRFIYQNFPFLFMQVYDIITVVSEKIAKIATSVLTISSIRI